MPIFPLYSRVYAAKPLITALLLMTLPLVSCANKEPAKLAELEQRVAALEAEGTEIKREVVNAHLGVQNLDARVEFLEREAAKNGVVVPYVPKRSITAEGMAEMREGQPPVSGASAQNAPMPPVNAPDSGSLLNPSPVPQSSGAGIPPAQNSMSSAGTNLASAPYSPNVLPYSPSASQENTNVPASPVMAQPHSSAAAAPSTSSLLNPAGPQPLFTPAASQATGQPQSLPVASAQAQTQAPAQPSGQNPATQVSPVPSAQAPQAMPSAQSPQPAQVASATSPSQSTGQPSVQSEPSQPSQPAPTNPEQKAYDMGLQLYRTGRFAESEAAFTAFMQAYPQSRLLPNALYWKGETHYARRQYTDAIFAFKDVQTRYPRNNKTPDSLLKTAMAYQKLGDAGNASLHLTVLFEDWPKSEAAQRARQLGLKP